jgi:hypothetical protein
MSYISDTKSDLITTVHNAISASVTSANTTAVDCSEYNAVIMYVELSASGSPNWTIALESSDTKDGVYMACYDGTLATDKALSTGALTASRAIVFKGVGQWVKAVPTENSGTGTCTVKLQPINL